MQNKNHKLFQMPSRFVSRLLRVAGHQPAPSAPPEQLDLDLGLDHITHTSLRVRDALPVRSAELWLLENDRYARYSRIGRSNAVDL